MLLIHDLPHIGDVDTVSVEPPFRTHVRMFVAKAQILGAQPLLTFDLLLEIGVIKRAAHHVDAAKQLSQNVSLFLVARLITALYDLHDSLTQRRQRIVGRCTVDDHVQTFGTETDIDARPERIDDVSDLNAVFVELGAVPADAAITPHAFRI